MSIGLEKEVEFSAAPASDLRFVAVRANLLPNEVRQARDAVSTRNHVLVALGTLVVLLGVWFGYSWWQTHAAQNDLAALHRQGAGLQGQTSQFTPLVTAQARTSAVQTQLGKLMVGDLSWRQMMTTLQSAAPAGVQLTQVAGTVTAGAAGAASGTGTTGSGATGAGTSVGTITITGSAHDKRTVANYADVLAATKGLASPFVNSVIAAQNGVTFDLTVLITSDALGGRWTPTTATTSGGK